MMRIFKPNMYCKSIFDINYDKLKKMNIKCLLFDLDNTLSPAKKQIVDNDVKNLFIKLKKDFKIILFSNNFNKRVSFFANYYGIDYAYLSLKPLYYKYIYLMLKYKLKRKEIACIGDQLMTDIIGGNKIGILTILVDPLDKEDGKSTYLNRKIEGYILNKYEKKNIHKKGNYYE